tara:strand:+ start:355 stop:636 length:282 start_codon:yes stop_codon:yes gene_type:complete
VLVLSFNRTVRGEPEAAELEGVTLIDAHPGEVADVVTAAEFDPLPSVTSTVAVPVALPVLTLQRIHVLIGWWSRFFQSGHSATTTSLDEVVNA